LLVEEDDSANDVEVVIGAADSNETDYEAADELEAALGIKAKEPGTALLFGLWRNLRALVSTRGNRTALHITTGHSADNLGSTATSTPVRVARCQLLVARPRGAIADAKEPEPASPRSTPLSVTALSPLRYPQQHVC
jgi:hypothetical protein